MHDFWSLDKSLNTNLHNRQPIIPQKKIFLLFPLILPNIPVNITEYRQTIIDKLFFFPIDITQTPPK